MSAESEYAEISTDSRFKEGLCKRTILGKVQWPLRDGNKKQAYYNRRTVGSGVFFAVCAESL
jgi:hypothetical protein